MLQKIVELMWQWDNHVKTCARCVLYERGQNEQACEVGNTIVRQLLQLLG